MTDDGINVSRRGTRRRRTRAPEVRVEGDPGDYPIGEVAGGVEPGTVITTDGQSMTFSNTPEAVEVVPGAPDPDTTDSGTGDPVTGPENGTEDQSDDAGEPGA